MNRDIKNYPLHIDLGRKSLRWFTFETVIYLQVWSVIIIITVTILCTSICLCAWSICRLHGHVSYLQYSTYKHRVHKHVSGWHLNVDCLPSALVMQSPFGEPPLVTRCCCSLTQPYIPDTRPSSSWIPMDPPHRCITQWSLWIIFNRCIPQHSEVG